MKQIEQYTSEMRELGLQFDSKTYEKQMGDLTDQLNHNVDKAIQNALNGMTAADLEGQLETQDGINNYKRTLLEDLDKRITTYSTGTLDQVNKLSEIYTKHLDDAQTKLDEYNKNANTVNTQMSTAKGFYVDGNGKPVYDASGKTIAMPEKPPMDPIYDKESGKLITFANDASGKIVANVQQVTTEASASQQAIQSYAQLVNSGKIKIGDVPKDLQQQVAVSMTQPKQ